MCIRDRVHNEYKFFLDELRSLYRTRCPELLLLFDFQLNSQVVTESMVLNGGQNDPLKNLHSSAYLLRNHNIDRDYRGLSNMGNTCFMNSYLQALYMSSNFRRDLLLNQTSLEDDAWELSLLFRQMLHQKNVSSVKPDCMKPILVRFFGRGLEQQDVDEFGLRYIDHLEVSLNKVGLGTILQDSFYGRRLSQIKCRNQGCDKSKDSDQQQFVHLAVNFKAEVRRFELLQMLQAEFQWTTVNLDCEFCGKKGSEMLKRPKIESWPEKNLIITLGRFRYDEKTGQRVKLSKRVKIPDQFNTRDVQNEPPFYSYQLCAIVVHKGISSEFGHYITLARELKDSKAQDWRRFDDDLVEKLSNITDINLYFAQRESETPYILFYQRIA
eukprot:TRINITY_DN24795_c0_g1_i1.p1 TRINITY_DN24795_c0_g1~~TRINITY_DN24795_c0_g1_i1.p1  ORF type:complete len:402 (-),score=33.88 TRINITY_DN24795_c0_g1_i1:96-1241(-)